LDGAARRLLRFRTASKRRGAATISDTLFALEVLHPLLIDPLVTAWWIRGAPDVAWQMTFIDLQAYGLTVTLNNLIKRITARERPWVEPCSRDPGDCGKGGAYRSFYSGHAAVTATGAGLICAHHTQLSLYQNDLLDTGACVVAVLGTAMTGALRVSSDNHWLSDVLTGHLLGYVSGYLLPTLLYYGEFRIAPHEHDDDPVVLGVLPMLEEDALGLTVLGLF
jgi:membrane-associated phospholipid phosphatase